MAKAVAKLLLVSAVLGTSAAHQQAAAQANSPCDPKTSLCGVGLTTFAEALREKGIDTSEPSLIAALSNTDPQIRSLAANQLSVLNADQSQLNGATSCYIVCSQSYSCRGSTLGSFTIEEDFNEGTINGYPITNVTVTKTQQ
jgi:hypothetical protein